MFMSWIKKLLGIDRTTALIPLSLESVGNRCHKCGSTDFSCDTYWKESCCRQCGWTVPVNKAEKPSNIQNVPTTHQSAKNYEQKIQNDDSKFSYSKISLFEKCPKAYHFRYLLKKNELFATIMSKNQLIRNSTSEFLIFIGQDVKK